MRDRTWGPRPEHRPRQAAYVTGAADARPRLPRRHQHGADRRRPDRLRVPPPRRRDRRPRRRPAHGRPRRHEHGWVERVVITATDAAGRHLRAVGEPVSRMIVNRHTFIDINSLVRWDLDGAEAWGEDQDMWPVHTFAAARRAAGSPDVTDRRCPTTTTCPRCRDSACATRGTCSARDDVLGSINLVTPERVARAAASVTTGEMIPPRPAARRARPAAVRPPRLRAPRRRPQPPRDGRPPRRLPPPGLDAVGRARTTCAAGSTASGAGARRTRRTAPTGSASTTGPRHGIAGRGVLIDVAAQLAARRSRLRPARARGPSPPTTLQATLDAPRRRARGRRHLVRAHRLGRRLPPARPGGPRRPTPRRRTSPACAPTRRWPASSGTPTRPRCAATTRPSRSSPAIPPSGRCTAACCRRSARRSGEMFDFERLADGVPGRRPVRRSSSSPPRSPARRARLARQRRRHPLTRSLTVADIDLAPLHLRPGDTVVVGQATAEPRALVEALIEQRHDLAPLRRVRRHLVHRPVPPGARRRLRRSSASARSGARRRSTRPACCRSCPSTSARCPALIAQRPAAPSTPCSSRSAAPDEHGDLLARSGRRLPPGRRSARARVAIAEVNPHVPVHRRRHRRAGDRFAAIVHDDRPLVAVGRRAPLPEDDAIARRVAELIPDGATIQFGIGGTPDAVLGHLARQARPRRALRPGQRRRSSTSSRPASSPTRARRSTPASP